MKKINFDKKKGIVFWITGLPGSGKTTVAKLIHKDIQHKFGATIEVSGDNLRKAFKYKDFDIPKRKIYAKSYSEFCNLISNKKINIIFSTVSLFKEVHIWNKKNIRNYYEIFIKTDVNKIIKHNKKKLYKSKKNIMGVSLKPDFPKKSNLTIKNDFKISTQKFAEKILKAILKDCS